MFVLEENPTFTREVAFEWPSGTRAWSRKIIEVEFLLPDEERFQELVDGLKEEADSDTRNTLLNEVVTAVYKIANPDGEERDPRGDGKTAAINNPLIRRAIVKTFLQHIQKNTFRG
ncbi:MAG: hypothetical protein BWK79_00145 [Beggiatoa sp. IS2]|nr:MAG: hypothetical protein BWK78_00035 [Thiotrichaceae bacterium IS1]OQW96064.1 MAG: hypothetical protein BWK79_00145 [Beggiatoa sp. IS2]